MTVEELIRKLEKLPGDLRVYISANGEQYSAELVLCEPPFFWIGPDIVYISNEE